MNVKYRSRCEQGDVAVELVVGREGSVEGMKSSKREEKSF